MKKEEYYGVYYDQGLFFGRILKEDCNCKECETKPHISMKFLIQRGDTSQFEWPKRRPDLDCFDLKFIIFGPVTLIGHGPFEIKELELLQKLYCLKKKQLYANEP